LSIRISEWTLFTARCEGEEADEEEIKKFLEAHYILFLVPAAAAGTILTFQKNQSQKICSVIFKILPEGS
jgi:hypothetical protein